MTTDYIAHLAVLPERHGALLLEQLHTASVVATVCLRSLGMRLPNEDAIPSQRHVYDHLVELTNTALDTYHITQQKAPDGTLPDAIWGEEENDIFWVEVTGLRDGGYAVKVHFNLLYR